MIEQLFEYLDDIYQNKMVKIDYGFVCYFKDYVKLAREIPKDKIVVDVGCSFGVQQILFKDHKGYIGIQKFRNTINAEPDFIPQFRVFVPNAKIIEGDFKDIYQQVGITDENKDAYYGIANHSLFHDLEMNKEDIEVFKMLFPRNYYAVDESSNIIKY